MPKGCHTFVAAGVGLCAAAPGSGRAQPKRKIQPPLTPMIDVTFQLLIFFLLAFQLRDPEGLIPTSLPGVVREPPAIPIRIEILPAGHSNEAALYDIERHHSLEADPNEVYRVLKTRKKAAGTSKIPVIIKPRADVRWRFVIEAFNAAVRAKLENVAFAPSSR